MADANRKDKGGFVVGPDPQVELNKLRSIFSSPRGKRSAQLARHLRESTERAREFAERDVAADLET
jgi:hypothetical protein